MRAGPGRNFDQTGEVRSEVGSHFGVELPRQLRTLASDGGGVFVAPATAPPGIARHVAGDGSAQYGDAHAVQDRHPREAVQGPSAAASAQRLLGQEAAGAGLSASLPKYQDARDTGLSFGLRDSASLPCQQQFFASPHLRGWRLVA